MYIIYIEDNENKRLESFRTFLVHLVRMVDEFKLENPASVAHSTRICSGNLVAAR